MKERRFRFKQFSVNHELSSMKVGVDGVLIGLWTQVEECKRILDAGCGCGVIALICAQRNPGALITALDFHEPSVVEATDNFMQSPWADRLTTINRDFGKYLPQEKFDLIISNPPYFDSGVEQTDNARLNSRHETTFGPMSIIHRAKELLLPNGRIAMIYPIDRHEQIEKEAESSGLKVIRQCEVFGREGKEAKRMMAEFGAVESFLQPKICQKLTIENSAGHYTDEYIALGKEFYLKF